MTTNMVAIVLAAGKGTRMKSDLPKVLHRVGGKPMLLHVLDAAEAAGATRSLVVIGFGADQVRAAIGGRRADIVLQREQLGTGHAVLQTAPLLEGEHGTIMVICGDTPLLTAATLAKLREEHARVNAKATVLTALMPDATGYGRIVRGERGELARIVEHKDATAAELAINEVNAGIYCFDKDALFDVLPRVGCDNAQGEYYLPDVLSLLRGRGETVWAVAADDFEETLGINSRLQLADADRILRRRKNEALMLGGVTMLDPATTYIDSDVTVGRDTVIYPQTWLEGATRVGAGCALGPCSRFADTTIGDRTAAQFCYTHECRIGNDVTMGPFVHLRPQTVIGDGVHIGNFTEVKNSTIGEGTKLAHLQYIGDCDMGSEVNMGCGTITVNYDGHAKHRTVIGDGAFVGCNVNLVAPVTVGDHAFIGAGSTITKPVPAGSLAVGRSRQLNIPDWVDKHH